jgi:hypothetical protein
LEWKGAQTPPKMLTHFHRAWAQGSFSESCGIRRTGETPQTPAALSAGPYKNLHLKKPAVGLFHNSSAESEAPGTEINSPIPTLIQKKTVNKHDFHRVCLQSEARLFNKRYYFYFN